MTGTISRVVRSFGSAWGYILPLGTTRKLYFNPSSLVQPELFSRLQEGQAVEFEEIADPVNGTRATHIIAG